MPGGRRGTRLEAIPGNVPALGQLPAGCAFAPRCRDRFDPCDRRPPDATTVEPGHETRCYLHDLAVRLAPTGRRP